MDAEMASWKSTGTYVDDVPPPGANIVSGMWIFRVKRPLGSPPVFKARYVARGFSQRQGVDFFQTFSPTPKMTTLRVLLHVAAQRDYELHSLDFSTAFVQGSLHEEIWLRRPPGFTGLFPSGTQWSLRRPFYGLRQAPREWHDTLRTTLAALGFAPSTADPSLFLCTDTTLPPFYVLVYVDDLVFATADTEAPTHVKSKLQKRHTCTDLGELVLQRFGLTYSSPQSTPLPTGHSPSAPPSDESVESSGPYPELVGCLIDTIYGYSEQQQPLVLEVICNGRRLQALVDSGASHSVCDRRTLEKFGESLEETHFTATMVDGTKLPIHGKSTLQLQIGALRWKPTLPITNIKGLDFILGRDFLKRFNPEIDWVNRKTCIYNNGKRVELRSWTDTGSVPETTLARFELTVNESNTGYLALVMAAAEEEVLEQDKDIMPNDLPAGVPPARTHEHEIVEEPGAKPVSREPYRLSPTELTDMKKQIEYLLDRQLIRPSTSPYSAPVLFTPKPDGSLRMCINYRALNKQIALTTAPVLILPDPDRDYVVEADAINQAVGAVLMQDHGNGLQPIAYLSTKLHGAELNYPIHDKEALAIVVAFKAWRCYLEGAKTTVYTDHCSLKYLKSQPTLSRRQERWVDFLETHFHYDIIYKPGLHNKADALSRPGHVAGIQLDGMNPLLKGLFQHGYSVDGEIATAEKQNLLQWEKDLAILLEEFHDVPYAGHFGSNKTLAGIAKYYYWPRMAADLQQFVTSCDTCQRMKSSKQKKTGLLQPLPVPEQPWQVVSLDFITGLPSTSRGHVSILVVIDKFSKMGHFIPTNATATAEATARLLFDRIITIHGIPATLISDRDPKLKSKFWKELMV
ncbi:unnamed protein product [Closterium sp. NIES-53]